ncbi:MAG: glycosyltransferase family 9 protein [Chloroflexi bacterium]|nr:glycosyltransferase family 9 protein [Chloroflexota bacterium]
METKKNGFSTFDKFPEVQKIAILRATNLGDFIAAIPALEAIRDTYPDAEIVYLGKPFHKALIESRPGPVDRAIVIPVTRGIRYEPHLPHLVESQEEVDAFLEAIRRERFDLAIQMHGGGQNTNPFVKRMGARYTVGMRTPGALELDRWMPYVYYQNEFLRLLELVRLVGAQPSHYEPRLPITEADRAEVHQRLPELQPSYAVLHPGASDQRRRWPPERFAQVADTLARQGLQIVITGTQHERDVIAAVVRAMQCPAINACDRLSIGGLAALLEAATIMISNDTGPMHVANAVGAPNVGIFWFGNAFNWAHPGRSKHRPLLSWTKHCPLCGQDMSIMDPPHDRCQHDTCFVGDVTVEEVLAAAFDLLAYAGYQPASQSSANGVMA